MSEPGSDRAVHWYYRLEGNDQGPVLLSRLRQLAHGGVLTSDDLVRKGKTGEWAPAGTFVEIDSPAAEAVSAAQAEAKDRILVNPNLPKRNLLKGFFGTISEKLSDFRSDLWWAISSRTQLIRAMAGYFALAIVIVSLVRVSIDPKRFDWKGPANPYSTCCALWDELKERRASEVNDASWQEFTERGRDQLLPIIAQLEREASSSNRTGQLLLWASRDCLPKMFLDARSEPSPSERRFEEYLKNVDLLRAGEPIYGGNVASHVQPFRQSKAVFSWFKDDPVTAFLTVFLTAANLAVVGWFVKRVFGRTTIWSNG